jgi:uncharacterized membrane protein
VVDLTRIEPFFGPPQHGTVEETVISAVQLAADVLSTAIAPSWDQIGKLGAIAVIRTALNYFLRREMHDAPAAG